MQFIDLIVIAAIIYYLCEKPQTDKTLKYVLLGFAAYLAFTTYRENFAPDSRVNCTPLSFEGKNKCNATKVCQWVDQDPSDPNYNPANNCQCTDASKCSGLSTTLGKTRQQEIKEQYNALLPKFTPIIDKINKLVAEYKASTDDAAKQQIAVEYNNAVNNEYMPLFRQIDALVKEYNKIVSGAQ